MKLSTDQTNSFWRLFTLAWARHCRAQELDPKNATARDAWRKQQIHEHTGLHSLTKIPRTGGAFVELMAELEIVAQSGILWQCRREGADVRHIAFRTRQLIAENDLDEDYAARIAKQALQLSDDAPTPDIDRLEPKQSIAVLRAIRIQVERMNKRSTQPF
jgi:hypothetical protein